MKNENRDKIAAFVNQRVGRYEKPKLFVELCSQIEGTLEMMKTSLEADGVPWEEDEAVDLLLHNMTENEAVVKEIEELEGKETPRLILPKDNTKED